MNAKDPDTAHPGEADAETSTGSGPALTPAAQRALAEAEERRQAASEAEKKNAQPAQRELGGRKGPDPVRFGDWENGGITSDF